MRKQLGRDDVEIARKMVERQVPLRQVGAVFERDESTMRYHLGKDPDAQDGRRDRPSVLDGWDERVAAVLRQFEDPRVVEGGTGHCEARQLHAALEREHGFTGSYQAVRRYLRRQFPEPVQAVRRVETPAGVQAQHDWFDFSTRIDGVLEPLHGLIGTLSHSRADFVSVSPTMTQVAWQTGHLALFHRYGGVPLWVRIDNLRTGVARGAGPTAVITPAFAAFARSCGFAVDPCRPRMGSDKGKTERAVRRERGDFGDLLQGDWPSLAALQGALDARSTELQARRLCPVTGTTVEAALATERRLLQPVPVMHEPFDCVVARRVSRDCLVSFEGRRYSVPFRWVGRTVEVRGTTQHVVIFADGAEVARHARRTAARLILDQAHFEGSSTTSVLAPTPLGRRAQLQLAASSEVPVLDVRRPLAAYADLLDDLIGTAGTAGTAGAVRTGLRRGT